VCELMSVWMGKFHVHDILFGINYSEGEGGKG